MNKDKILYGIIAVLVGLFIGYVGTNQLNAIDAPASNQTQQMPTDHPPITR